MKTGWIVLISILVVLVIAGIWLNSYIKSLSNAFDFKINVSAIDLPSLFNGSTSNADLSITVTNTSNLSIPIEGLGIQIYYGSDLLAYSTQPTDSFVIPSKKNGGSVTIINNITLNANLANPSLLISLAGDFLLHTPIDFAYTVQGKIFNFYPLNYTGTFTYTR